MSGFKRTSNTLGNDLEMKITSKFEEISEKNESNARNFFYKLRTDCSAKYSEKMEKAFNSTSSYFRDSDLQKLHDDAKNEPLQLVCSISIFIKPRTQLHTLD